MDESDEDIDPNCGPMADLMAEHQLASERSPPSVNKRRLSIVPIVVPSRRTRFYEYCSYYFNVRLLFTAFFDDILDYVWHRSTMTLLSDKHDDMFVHQQYPYTLRSSKNLSIIVLVGQCHSFST
jgi:hypothetical protein